MEGKLPRLTGSAMLRALNRDGWIIARRRGSHVILEHRLKPDIVVVPVHAGRTLKIGTLSGILEDAGLTPEEFVRLL